MGIVNFIYNAALHTIGVAAILVLRGRGGEDPAFWTGRFGSYALPPASPGQQTLWFHAASVGEVSGAVPTILQVLGAYPGARLVLSVGTSTGYRAARSRLPSSVTVVPFPVDLPHVLRGALAEIRPNLFVAFESEFWPNLFAMLRERSVPAVLLNGRLSARSLARYRALRRLFLPVFLHFRWLAMGTEADRRNVLALGVPKDRVLVLGSSKHDGLAGRVNPDSLDHWRRVLSLPSAAVVMIGGSLRKSECTGLLRVYQALSAEEPALIGVFVPRHLDRVDSMARWLREQGIPFHLLSRLEAGEEARSAPVVLVDRIGILFELYGLGDLIFCGGTLEPIGGHNILEPAAWGKAVFYGPNIQKVMDEHRALEERGAGILVRDEQELVSCWKTCLKDVEGLKRLGAEGRKAVLALSGVAARQVKLIGEALGEGAPSEEQAKFSNIPAKRYSPASGT